MTGNALSGLILMSVKTPEATSSPKSASKSEKADEDSFSGIFREKMQDARKPLQRADKTTSAKPLETSLRNTDVQDKKPAESEDTTVTKSEYAEKSSSLTNQEKSSEVKTESDDGKDTQKEEKSDETDEAGTLNLAAALLESLFAKLDELTSGLTGETAKSDESGSDKTQAVNPLELVKTLLDGKMDKIKELLDKVQPESENTEVKSLLDQLKTLLAKVGEIKDSLKTDASGKMSVQLEGRQEDPAVLIAQMQAQGREIIDKIKAKLTETVKQAEPKSSAANPVMELPKPSAVGSGAEVKDEAPEKTQDVKVEPKAQREPVEVAVQTESKPELSRNQVLQDRLGSEIQPQKIDSTSAAKPEKADFQLSEKPLSQTVTSQVMLKVKLMAGESKQEMEVQLKPDYLGKMTLKIIHDRGEILAKITTESEQVKSILESNMQLLKDSLEKSGFSVQGLNVYVGNGNGGGQMQNQDSRKDRTSGESVAKAGNNVKSTAAGRTLFGQDMPEGSIDLSA